MDQQNIDRLFREKLDHLEVKPSSGAWSQVEKQIRPSKTLVIYWVAASVSLLFISWIVWPEATSEAQFTPIASEVTFPTQMDIPEFVMPVIEEREKQPVKQRIDKKVKKTPVQSQFAVNKVETSNEEALPVMEDLETKTMVASEEIQEPVKMEEVAEKPIEQEYKAVKITYIASAVTETKAETQKADSTGVLKKFIAFAEKIDPGDMLADIKTAKDNLLNGGLKNKKEGSSL